MDEIPDQESLRENCRIAAADSVRHEGTQMQDAYISIFDHHISEYRKGLRAEALAELQKENIL